MMPNAGKLFWISFSIISICSVFPFPADVLAQEEWHYSSNNDDYDFGWFAVGTYPNGSVPTCLYCVNALLNETTGSPDALDRKVGLYRCDGVQGNEIWAYHEPTKAIVFSNLTTRALCIDVVTSSSLDELRLRPCNSSSATQRWTRALDGHRVISGTAPSNENPIFMVASLPDQETNPSNQVYSYPLNRSSFLYSNVPGFTYSDNFTFLSKKTLVDGKTQTLTSKGLLQIANSTLDRIVNGDFERTTIQAGYDITASNWKPETNSYFALRGWVIDVSGLIDYVKTVLVPTVSGGGGQASVHLNTYSSQAYWGSISQTSKSEVGKEYNLSFVFRGFPPDLQIQSRKSWNCTGNGRPYTEARLQLLVTNATTDGNSTVVDGSGFTKNFTIDPHQNWQHQSVRFTTLTNVTRISFTSLNNNNESCGPMIDNVVVSPFRPGSKTNITWVLVGSIGGVVLLAFVACLLGLIYRKRYCGPEEDYSDLYKTENARVFSEKEIGASTKNFSSILGEGGFGTVYKAEFPDGTVGAVKVEKPRGLKSSKVLASEEIAVLLRVHHRNLVNLIGFCIHKGRHMLVFEYLLNGSLYDRLHESILAPRSPPAGSAWISMDDVDLEKSYEKVLPWQKRVKIASDVAYGLEYLHHDADPPIVHRDVKSQNILLTATDTAKLADFGLSKAAPASATVFESVETMVRGSIGYLDPQYFQTGVFSSKSDVYSYGVVLLELISGHQAIYNAASLASWAAPYMAAPSLYQELVDKKLNGKYEQSELQSLVELSKMCMLEDGRMRPNMRQVVAFLNTSQLVVHGAESSDQVQETISGEAYDKMHPLFLEATGKDSSTSENFHRNFGMSSPKARD